MKRIFTFCLALMALATVSAADNIPAKIKAFHKANEQFECAFTEVCVTAKTNKKENREGKLVFQAPDDLRMDYSQPQGDYVLINKDRMEQSKKGKEQSVKVKNKGNRYATYRATLLSCLGGDVEKAAQLNDAQAVCTQSGNRYLCTITAEKASNKEIKELKLEYDAATGQIVSMTITQGNGNYSTYTIK